MNILFKGKTLLTQKWIESDSILQGNKTGGFRIFLKHRETFPKWVECDIKTVKQIKF
jgi:hypothetical protein